MRSLPAPSSPMALLFLCVALAGQATAQCILEIPSFEIGGQGGAIFGGWQQFGAIGSVPDAHHGQKAAR